MRVGCKNGRSRFVRIDGGCLACDADAGEACRTSRRIAEPRAAARVSQAAGRPRPAPEGTRKANGVRL